VADALAGLQAFDDPGPHVGEDVAFLEFLFDGGQRGVALLGRQAFGGRGGGGDVQGGCGAQRDQYCGPAQRSHGLAFVLVGSGGDCLVGEGEPCASRLALAWLMRALKGWRSSASIASRSSCERGRDSSLSRARAAALVMAHWLSSAGSISRAAGL